MNREKMPHFVRKTSKGYFVSDVKPLPNGRYKNYSKEPLTKTQAEKQLLAINLSLIRHGESPKKVWKKV